MRLAGAFGAIEIVRMLFEMVQIPITFDCHLTVATNQIYRRIAILFNNWPCGFFAIVWHLKMVRHFSHGIKHFATFSALVFFEHIYCQQFGQFFFGKMGWVEYLQRKNGIMMLFKMGSQITLSVVTYAALLTIDLVDYDEGLLRVLLFLVFQHFVVCAGGITIVTFRYSNSVKLKWSWNWVGSMAHQPMFIDVFDSSIKRFVSIALVETVYTEKSRCFWTTWYRFWNGKNIFNFILLTFLFNPKM